jgi:hypothetical protein
MKRCPTCGSSYTDESLAYCLQDGALLAAVSAASGARELAATEILNLENPPTARMMNAQQTAMQREARPTERDYQNHYSGGAPPVPRSQSNKVVAGLLTVIVLLLLALGGLGVWALLRDNKKTVDASNVNDNQNKGGRAAGNTSTASRKGVAASATPVASLNASAAQKEVTAALNGWAQTIKDKNIDEHMKYYADVLDTYYTATNVSRDRVRADRERAFSKYDKLDMQLANVRVEVDSALSRAVVTFDKTFDFRGEKNFSGSGLNRFWLVKSNGGWRITGEKDLEIYYINK